MALKLKYTDEHGILHINMSPTGSAKGERTKPAEPSKVDIDYPRFDTINNRFGQYDIFGGKYDVKNDSGEESDGRERSLFTARYNSVEEELANTPYAFNADRRASPLLDLTIRSTVDSSPSRDIEDDRFFNRSVSVQYEDGLFGPQIDLVTKSIKSDSDEEAPAFTVTQLIHAQDRYFDLSTKSSVLKVNEDSGNGNGSDTKSGSASTKSIVRELTNKFEIRSAPASAKSRPSRSRAGKDEAFKILQPAEVKAAREIEVAAHAPVSPVLSTVKKKRESSFAIITETPSSSRPTSPRSLPIEIKPERISPFRGRGFREETSRHNTPKTSRTSSRANSPLRRRTNSLSKIENMAQTATLPPTVHTLMRPHSPRNYIKENIEEVREISELNREKHEAEAEQKKREEEEALLKEMGLLDQNAKLEPVRSLAGSRTTSRSNSPNKIKLRSRSNSPSTAILLYENIPSDSTDFIDPNDGARKPVVHKSRVRSISRSQPQSNNGSPQHSKIPKRQNSVSPTRTTNKRDTSVKTSVESNLNKNQRFISNSTSSIHDTIKIGGTTSDIKKNISKSTQHLSISPANIKGKPPISPGRGGPPPSNRAINAKRLSPIAGTPNKSPVEDSKPSSARTQTKSPSPVTKKPIKTAGNTPATSRLNSRQQSRNNSRSQSPDKKKDIHIKSTVASRSVSNKTSTNKSVTRTPSTRTLQKTSVPSKLPKQDIQKSINRTNSIKNLSRTPSTKTLNTKPPTLRKKDSIQNLKTNVKSVAKADDVDSKSKSNKQNVEEKSENKKEKDDLIEIETSKQEPTSENHEEKPTQDSETQYDKITNDKGELVILTKKNVVSMTTAAITAQPLEVVTTVTNQLPAALEKAREKGMFERLGSKDSLAPKEIEEKNDGDKNIEKETKIENECKTTKMEQIDIKPKMQSTVQPIQNKNTIIVDDTIKLKPLQPPFNNPQVEKVKQKIDDILKAPEVSPENILKAVETEIKSARSSFKNAADRTKNDIIETKGDKLNNIMKDEKLNKLIKDEKSKITELREQGMKQTEKNTEKIRSEATKIVDTIITPVEEPPKELIDAVKEKSKDEMKKNIEPIVMVVNEKRNGPKTTDTLIKMNEALVKGEPEIEVQSSNVSTPNVGNITAHNKISDSNSSDQSTHSNGGFPQSTSTTPKPPPRTQKPTAAARDDFNENAKKDPKTKDDAKKKNMPQRLLGKCAQKTRCCTCCVKPQIDSDEIGKEKKMAKDDAEKAKTNAMSKLNCCKKKEEEDNEVSKIDVKATKTSRVEFENETKRKRTFRDVFCGCCVKKHRIGDSAAHIPRGADVTASPTNQGCCGRRAPQPQRRDSILSDQSQKICCNNRFCNWLCRRAPPPSRRNSVFSKNKSLSPTLPPEDTRTKLDPSLVEHSSVIRGAVPVLPIALAYFCLFCNIIVPGLGTVFSGVFCLCFGIPRFGVHDSAKHRIGSFLINLVVGCGQLFTVLFCLVGWGWSIWWGVIMLRVARKYRRLAAEAKAQEEEEAPPVVANNHNPNA